MLNRLAAGAEVCSVLAPHWVQGENGVNDSRRGAEIAKMEFSKGAVAALASAVLGALGVLAVNRNPPAFLLAIPPSVA